MAVFAWCTLDLDSQSFIETSDSNRFESRITQAGDHSFASVDGEARRVVSACVRFDREKLSGLGPRNLRQWTTTKLSRTSRRRSRAARSHPRVRVFKRSIQRTNRSRHLCLSFMDRGLW